MTTRGTIAARPAAAQPVRPSRDGLSCAGSLLEVENVGIIIGVWRNRVILNTQRKSSWISLPPWIDFSEGGSRGPVQQAPVFSRTMGLSREHGFNCGAVWRNATPACDRNVVHKLFLSRELWIEWSYWYAGCCEADPKTGRLRSALGPQVHGQPSGRRGSLPPVEPNVVKLVAA